MKLCKDCEYFYTTHLANFCKSPQNGVSPIDGSVTVRWAQANRRGTSEKHWHCGEDAIFWVEKTVKKPWYKFWK